MHGLAWWTRSFEETFFIGYLDTVVSELLRLIISFIIIIFKKTVQQNNGPYLDEFNCSVVLTSEHYKVR